MNRTEIIKVLGEVRAIITDSHVVYTSGKHGSAYVNKDAIYPRTQATAALTEAMAEAYVGRGVEAVVAPVVGGVILSQWVAHHLSRLEGREILGVYAEKTADGAGFELRRGYADLVRGRKTLVVEDILNTGGSVKKVVEALAALGTPLVGVAAICNRGGVTAAMVGAPRLTSLLEVKLDAWDADACPLCARGVPVNVEVGKGKAFLAARG